VIVKHAATRESCHILKNGGALEDAF